jgi:hypothetical protein
MCYYVVVVSFSQLQTAYYDIDQVRLCCVIVSYVEIVYTKEGRDVLAWTVIAQLKEIRVLCTMIHLVFGRCSRSFSTTHVSSSSFVVCFYR